VDARAPCGDCNNDDDDDDDDDNNNNKVIVILIQIITDENLTLTKRLI
jgi:hypothetical protein